MPENLNGFVEQVTFHNSENGFAILRVQVKGRKDLVTVTGNSTSVTAGAFAREGYRRTDLNRADVAETLTCPRFLKKAFWRWRTGVGELWRSYNKRAFVRALQRLLPAIRAEDLEAIPAGVRAQIGGRDGSLAVDVVIREDQRVLNVGNTPSRAATASLSISKLIVGRFAARMS